MPSGKMEAVNRGYISLPKKHMAALSQHYELDHGLIIKDLKSYLSEGYLRAYFREWGTVTKCKVNKVQNSNSNTVAYVRFSSEEEADGADWASPHYIGGFEVQVKRVVSPKLDDDDTDIGTDTVKPKLRRSMGLGYILEDAQWLDDDLEE